MSASSSYRTAHVVDQLMERYGDLPWWPGTPEEVMIGAVLTQQTRWVNVETALSRMIQLDICSLEAIHRESHEKIEEAIRCTGFYRVKTRRLKALASTVMDKFGGVEGMAVLSTPDLRDALLAVHGIGEETADSILCYALGRTSFVIDAYTERICSCAGIPDRKGKLKTIFEAVLPEDNAIYRRCHAHFVEYAKEFCGNNRCEQCVIRNTGK